jgi:cytidylate kinase
MIKDPIVYKVRRYRQEHARENDNDLDKIIESLRKRERDSKRKVLSPGPKSRLDKTGS